MNERQLGLATTAELLDIYVEAAITHGQSTLSGDKGANHKAYDVITGVYCELRKRGDQSISALLSLLDHEDRSVGTWAASHVLEFAPEQGELALERIAKTGGLLAFNAEMTLSEWRKGNLKFP